MDGGSTTAAATTGSSSGGGSHQFTGSRIQQEHRKYMSESSCCPRCGHKINRLLDWVGLPAGVKFDPTDQELIEHLEAKVRPGAAAAPSHPLIDEFIPTIEGEDGICYTHPEKLPGLTKDGLSRHFFHRPSKAYTSGTRKRRKIQPPSAATSSSSSTPAAAARQQQQQQRSETRWHKTGKTRPVVVAGRQRGCKKILVLYTNFGKHRKPQKTNWVMHQYHLGEAEEEREGELVVSKIFYQTQPRQCGVAEPPPPATSSAAAPTTVDQTMTSGGLAAVPVATSSYAGGGPAFQGAVGIDEFNFAQFRSSFEEVGVGASGQVQARDDEEEVHAGHHHQLQQQEHGLQHQYANQEQQRMAAAAAAFHVRTPTDPIATLITPPPLLHHGSVVLRRPPQQYDHGAMSYHDQQQKDIQQAHEAQKFEGRPTSGLEEVIMGCTSRRTNKGTEPSGGGSSSNKARSTDWQYPSFWPSDDLDHHG